MEKRGNGEKERDVIMGETKETGKAKKGAKTVVSKDTAKADKAKDSTTQEVKDAPADKVKSGEMNTQSKKKTLSEKSSSKEDRSGKKEKQPKKAAVLSPQSSLPRIGGTMLSEEDRDVLANLVMNYGAYSLVVGHKARKVDVLVAGRSARSIKVPSLLLFDSQFLCTVASGGIVVSKQWLYDSLEAEGWKDPKDYIDPLAEEGIRRRRERGKGLFAECGPVFICKGTKASREEIESVIRAADGRVAQRREGCWLCIGDTKGDCVSENAFYESIVRCELVKKEGDCDECESEEFYLACSQETIEKEAPDRTESSWLLYVWDVSRVERLRSSECRPHESS